MNQEKIKAILELLKDVKYYEWLRLSQAINQKYDSESKHAIAHNTIQDSESLERLLLMEFDLLGNDLNK